MATILGQEYQHALLTVSLARANAGDGTEIDSFKKISWKDGAEKKPVHNHKGQIIGFTFDNQKTEGSLSMLRSEWEALKQDILDNADGVGIGQVRLELIVAYGVSPLAEKTMTIEAMINEEAFNSEDSQEALQVELPLFVFSAVDENNNSFINYDA